MTDARDSLERIGDRVPAPEPAFERLLGRRDRKRRNERITSLAVGLLVIAIMGGAAFLGSGVEPRNSPGASVAPSAQAWPPASQQLLRGVYRRLEPGPHWLTRGDLLITFEVPAGWRSFSDLAVVGEGGAAVEFWFADRVPLDPCRWTGSWSDPGTSVAGLTAALARQPGTSTPSEVTLAGYAGRSMRLRAPGKASTNSLKACDMGDKGLDTQHIYVRWWMGDSWHGQDLEEVNRLWILDVHGERLVVVARWFPSTSARMKEQMSNVLASISIT
jgi:hypothetical protein